MHSTTDKARGPEPGVDPGHQHRNRPVSSDLGDLGLLGVVPPATALPRTPQAVLALQAAAGNAAVSELLSHARLIPAVQREDAATDAATEATDINAQYKAAVGKPDWARAAVVLNGFNDTDLASRVKDLSDHRIDLRRATPAWATRVTRAILDADYTEAKTGKYWGDAAELLNGYSDTDINGRIGDLKRPQRVELFAAAATWNTRVMGAITQIDRDAAYQGSVRRDDWARAAELLNDFKDLERRVKSMTLADRKRIREAAPASAARVIWSTLDIDYRAAIGKNWIEAAELLNAFNDADIKQRIKDLSKAQRKLLMAGARQSRLIGTGDRIIDPIRGKSSKERGKVFGEVAFKQVVHDAPEINGEYSSRADIVFTPDPTVVDCPNIGFIQTSRFVKLGTNENLEYHEKQERRRNKKNEAIDRTPDKKYGWYGLRNDLTSAETVTPGVSPGPPVVPAKFWDAPGDRLVNATFSFETSIVAREGPQANLVYSVVHWGFDIDNDGHLKKHEEKIEDRPSEGFATAIDAWNAQAAGPEPTVKTDAGVSEQQPLPAVW